MPDRHKGTVVDILRKYDVNPRVVTEVAPWGNPHYFSVFADTCPDLERYRAVDADWDAGAVENMWERYQRRIENGPPYARLKFSQMLGQKKFEKVSGWYFNTDDLPSDLIFFNNALYWSFPTLTLAKGLRDIRAHGLILIKDHVVYGDQTIGLLEAMSKDLNFDIGVYLVDTSAHREHVFEELGDPARLSRWNETMKKWLDSSSKDFFMVLKNRGGEIPRRDCLRLAYEAWLYGFMADSTIYRKDIGESFEEFGRNYLLQSIKRFGSEKENDRVRNILQLLQDKKLRKF